MKVRWLWITKKETRIYSGQASLDPNGWRNSSNTSFQNKEEFFMWINDCWDGDQPKQVIYYQWRD